MNDYFKVDSTYNDDCRNEFTVKELGIITVNDKNENEIERQEASAKIIWTNDSTQQERSVTLRYFLNTLTNDIWSFLIDENNHAFRLIMEKTV